MKYSYCAVTSSSVLLFASLASAELLYYEDFSQGESALDVWTTPWSEGPNSVSVGDGAMLVTGRRVDVITGDTRVADLANTSVRARVSLDGTRSRGLGILTNVDPDRLFGYQAGIDPDNAELYLGWNDPARFNQFTTSPTDFDLLGDNEFNMQLDVFTREEGGYDMKFWAWPAGDSMPDFPQLTHVDTSVVLDPGEPAFLFDNLGDPGRRSTARVHEFQVSSQSIMSSNFDCNIDGVVNIADANCSTPADLSTTLDVAGLILGDLDGNGTVEFNDFLRLSQNFGSSGLYTDGDLDVNGTVEFSDFLILSNNFGATTVVSAVPEPTGIGCLLVAFVAIFDRTRRASGYDLGRTDW